MEGKGLFMALSTGGRRLAFALELVKSVEDWRDPLFLPGGVSWLRGIRPVESQAVPVLRESFLGDEGGRPEVVLFLDDGKGGILGIPGSAPAIFSGRPRRGDQDEALPEWLGWEIEVADKEMIGCVDVRCLYRVLGLKVYSA